MSRARTPEERRRLAEAFGEDAEADSRQSADDRPEPGEASGHDDEWWRAQRPPHHEG